jgi:adenylylsulfate kinase-like enzyme
MIYILYGQPGSGKTTLGKMLADHLNTPFIIDGDEFREMFTNKNYGKDGREENIKNANAVATYLNKKGKGEDGSWMSIYYRETPNSIQGRPVNMETDVVMCLVNPYEHLREELKQNNESEVMEILLESDRDLRRDYHCKEFETGNPDLTINTDGKEDATFNLILSAL